MYDELVARLRAGTYTVEELSIILPKAADAIEELQQTVDHYKGCSDDWYKEACDYKAMLPRWISVTERLPEPYFDVLSTDGESVGIASYQKKGGYWLGSDVFYDAHVAVTHWMPLPEPPKED